jgi:hypothetical protein
MVWYLRQGANVKEAQRLLAQNSATPEAFRRLLGAGRRDDALLLLKRTLEAGNAEQTIAAMKALSETMFTFQQDQTRSYTETIRQLIVPARALVARLSREDAARLARQLLAIDASLERSQSPSWAETLTKFVRDYDGTDAALLAQVELLTLDPRQMLKRIADLDQFARDHPGTNAGAKALFQEGWDLHVNVAVMGIEARGSDPTERLLRVAAIVKELESGKFPPSEWVEKAPSLMIGFFRVRDAAAGLFTGESRSGDRRVRRLRPNPPAHAERIAFA